MSRPQGDKTESFARDWLQQQGLKIIGTNFHSRWGEIDIIAQDRKTLCFTEVRYRKNNLYGTATESVSYSKQQKLIKTAQYFLLCHSEWSNEEIRFDIIGLSGSVANPAVDWLKNAFIITA